MNTYPKRDSHFAHEYVRRMVKVCLANELGQEVFTLLTIIVHTEDAAHYRRAVNFWNAQLMAVAGFQNEKALERARTKAVKAGWLHYQKGTRTSPPQYWGTIPAVAADMDDSPTDEGEVVANLSPMCRPYVGEVGLNPSLVCRPFVADLSLECRTSIPVPVPNPILSFRAGDPQIEDPYPAGFPDFWTDYPAKEQRVEAEAEWHRLSPSVPLKIEIKTGLEAWKKTERWRRGMILHPHRWLKNGSWANVPQEEFNKKEVKNGRSGNRGTDTAYREPDDDPLAGRPIVTTEDIARQDAERQLATIAEF